MAWSIQKKAATIAVLLPVLLVILLFISREKSFSRWMEAAPNGYYVVAVSCSGISQGNLQYLAMNVLHAPGELKRVSRDIRHQGIGRGYVRVYRIYDDNFDYTEIEEINRDNILRFQKIHNIDFDFELKILFPEDTQNKAS